MTATPVATARTGRRGRAIGLLVLRRLAFAVPVLLLVGFALFALAKASPFDPVERYFGLRIIGASPERVAQIRANWGVDQPVVEQYLAWLRHAVAGDFGDSLSLQQPVAQVIGERLGWSVLLVSVGFALALLLGLVLGTLAAWRQGGWLDRAITATAYALEAAPVFWLGLAALYVFALELQWLPGGGLTDAGAALDVGQVVRHLLLPASVLAVSQAPWYVLFVRQNLLESFTSDHVIGARARGLPDHLVVSGHALRTSLLPFLTLLGARIPELITGALLVETVFSWPGIARATVDAALNVDFALLGALTVLATAVVLLGNLLADVLYALADPRVGLDG
ncbi:ABC transporter permease [Saccharothrix australiensis]|uniref:Peptide/nickel transport system permease protein n=1 Tax=Saccharothrix australiensis TaxID=2072 RepID=A0A495W6E1_9PSEU|nr:ABC transporter permease [Saccharothrix australiensis]RKT55368.1 peptide/nickel transport system permease protein [Saccharothrix australiensis]